MRGSEAQPFRRGDRVRLRPRALGGANATGTVAGRHETSRGMIFVTVRLDPTEPGREPEEVVVSPSEIELLPGSA